MAGIRNHKLSDAIRRLGKKPSGGKPVPTHETAAEQTREAKESGRAKGAAKSNRDRMVDIGRANRQTGRQGQ